MTYALDTNIIIHLLHGNLTVRDNRDKIIKQNANIIIPPIVDYEMRRGFLCKSTPAKEKEYNLLCNYYSVGRITSKILEQGVKVYADLYKKRLTIGELDILIAAFCIANNYTFVTDNTKHFKNIEGLLFVNWNE